MEEGGEHHGNPEDEDRDRRLAEIKALDPDTRITLHYIRSIINQGKVPVRKAGTKLVDLDKVLEYLARGDEDEKTPTGEIRRVEL